MDKFNDDELFNSRMNEYEKKNKTDEIIGIDINLIEDQDFIAEFNLFKPIEKKLIALFLKHPEIESKDAAEILGCSLVWISQIRNREKVNNFISKLQLNSIIDNVRLNFAISQIANRKNLQSQDQKIRENAIKIAILSYEKFYKPNTNNNNTSSSSGLIIDPDISPSGI